MKDFYKKKSEKVVGWFGARCFGSSTPNRLLWDLCGKPLFYWSVKNACMSKFINDKILVHTESEKLRKIAEQAARDTNSEGKIIFTDRTYEQCRDMAEYSPPDYIKSLLGYDEEVVVHLASNYPLIKSIYIDKIIDKFYSDFNAREVMLVNEAEVGNFTVYPKGYLFPVFDSPWIGQRQKYPPLFKKAGIAVWQFPERKYGSVAYVEIPKYEGIDIHNKNDLIVARAIMEEELRCKKKKQE